MARPFKAGLDYFPYDVGLTKDKKLRKAKMKYGASLSCQVYTILLQILYGDKGYYIDYSEKDDIIWEISEHLQGKYAPDGQTIEKIIELLVECELFSRCHFDNKIITSKRAQQTYYTATVERKIVNIDFSIWILSEDEMKALSSKSVILSNYINRPNNGVNRPNNEVNLPSSTQSKVKESKVKESKEEYSIKNEQNFTPPTLQNIIDYCKERNNNVDPQKFYDYYTTDTNHMWEDRNGNKVKSWKQKILTWEQHEKPTQAKTQNNPSYDLSQFSKLNVFNLED